ncbi:ATP-binding cassette domain-containing protein [Pirellulales bacterium]|nr:ATP-binding cassette domain-containing protein [Pirellulales bacterium]
MTSGDVMNVADASVLPADIPLLSIDRLTVRSGTLPVIDNLELDVSAGRRVAVIGSGRGSRAALLDAICGLRSATSGSVRLDGRRLKQAFSAKTFWGILFTGVLVGLLCAAAAVDIDRLWLAVVKRGLVVEEPFTITTFGKRLRSYFRAELAIDRLAGNWRIVTADGREVLAVRRDLSEARELRNQMQAAVTARRIGPGVIPDITDLVGDANEPQLELLLDESTLDRLAAGKRRIRFRGWSAFGFGLFLGIGMSWTIWQRGRRLPEVAASAGVARTFRVPRVFPAMTIFENVLVAVEQGVRIKSSSWWQLIDKSYCVARTEELIRSVGLADQSFTFASDLSLYERRCLEIARGLAMDPRVLLVDEPADGLAATQQDVLASLLREVCGRELTLVLTSASEGPFTEICDYTVNLSPH